MRVEQGTSYEKGLRSGSGIEGTQFNNAAQRACEEYIAEVFADRPDLAKMVTPDYPFGGKRILQDSNFYPALLRDNVELVPHAVVRVTPTGIVGRDRYRAAIDVLVMCTGFTAARVPGHLDVVGRGGRIVARRCGTADPYAYSGMTVPVSQLLHALRAEHQRRPDHVPARAPGRIRASATWPAWRGGGSTPWRCGRTSPGRSTASWISACRERL